MSTTFRIMFLSAMVVEYPKLFIWSLNLQPTLRFMSLSSLQRWDCCYMWGCLTTQASGGRAPIIEQAAAFHDVKSLFFIAFLSSQEL
jgi:hypothetical protein